MIIDGTQTYALLLAKFAKVPGLGGGGEHKLQKLEDALGGHRYETGGTELLTGLTELTGPTV